MSAASSQPKKSSFYLCGVWLRKQDDLSAHLRVGYSEQVDRAMLSTKVERRGPHAQDLQPCQHDDSVLLPAQEAVVHRYLRTEDAEERDGFSSSLHQGAPLQYGLLGLSSTTFSRSSILKVAQADTPSSLGQIIPFLFRQPFPPFRRFRGRQVYPSLKSFRSQGIIL